MYSFRLPVRPSTTLRSAFKLCFAIDLERGLWSQSIFAGNVHAHPPIDQWSLVLAAMYRQRRHIHAVAPNSRRVLSRCAALPPTEERVVSLRPQASKSHVHSHNSLTLDPMEAAEAGCVHALRYLNSLQQRSGPTRTASLTGPAPWSGARSRQLGFRIDRVYGRWLLTPPPGT
jgi:hypothetical protein